MNNDNKDPWLDHIMAKADWPEPSDDLHCRIMQQIDRPFATTPIKDPLRWTMLMAGLVAIGFTMGFFYPVWAEKSNLAHYDAAYYSDTHLEFTSILGS